MDASNKILEDLFRLDNIELVYEKEIAPRSFLGMDRMDSTAFDKNKIVHFDVIQRKCIEGTYRFSPYVEVLKCKGRADKPRVISIPTIRDRIVLHLLKEFLHLTFPDSVNHDLPNSIIKKLGSFIVSEKAIPRSFVKLDIKSFYDSIDHVVLILILSQKISSSVAVRLIRSAIESPTVAPGSRKQESGRHRNQLGVPQGLAISNILADIYLDNFDAKAKGIVLYYQRYVDDILAIVDSAKSIDIINTLTSELELINLSLNESKSRSGSIAETIEYLGYRFALPLISVRQPTVDRFVNSIAARFTSYRKGKAAFMIEHPNMMPETHREVFIEDLNEKITGALSETKRYGWIFFFSEINDVALLHKLDSIVESFFCRLEDFNFLPPSNLKSLAKSYYEARHSPRSGYIHDYSSYVTVQDKLEYIKRRGLLNPEKTYSQLEIERIFESVKRAHLSSLEMDVGTNS
jgi:hypothetical protein